MGRGAAAGAVIAPLGGGPPAVAAGPAGKGGLKAGSPRPDEGVDPPAACCPAVTRNPPATLAAALLRP